MRQVVFVSATPGPFEREHSEQVVEQLIRPTGLLDPIVEVRPVDGQIDDLLAEVRIRVANGQRCLVTTLTKRNAEQLAEYMAEMGVKVHYLHSEIETLERIEILRDLRIGVYDVVVGINLLREGLDLPEVSLVAILDADKEGYLRSETSLIQTIGRAARHSEGRVIMYADRMTGSMERAIGETNRRRAKQEVHNAAHGIVPTSIHKAIRDLSELRAVAEAPEGYDAKGGGQKGRGTGNVRGEDAPIITSPEEIEAAVATLEKEMKQAAMAMEFERAAELRDQMYALRAALASPDNPLGVARPHPSPSAATAGSRGGRGGGRYARRGRR
jgi:excinuclease ABC subunit B